RHLNPTLTIHGLYGGTDQNRWGIEIVSPWLTTHWEYPLQDESASRWKWLNVDIMVAQWYEEFGHQLNWSFLCIHPWDVLCLRPLDRFMALRSQNQALLYPGPWNEIQLREVQWMWIERNGVAFDEFQPFKNQVQAHFQKQVDIIASPLFLTILPRKFIEQSHRLLKTLPGMVEFRMPTLLKAQGVEILSPKQGVPEITLNPQILNFNWPDTLNPRREEITQDAIYQAFQGTPPQVLFHPVYKSVSFQDIQGLLKSQNL
ncbi:MAG: hypothetical protein K2X66_04875, partial [Cyanobacteria bacterium]|nr:hypothetical protein [Cyanobacteriota bacterium]